MLRLCTIVLAPNSAGLLCKGNSGCSKTNSNSEILAELTFLALDEIDKSGTTQLRIRNIEKIGFLEEPPFDEPPFSELPFNDPDPDPILITEQELVGQLGSYEEFIDS